MCLMNIKEKYSKRLQSLRKKANITQEELAFRSKLDRTYISSVENGKRNISINNIEKIATALKISVKDFFDTNDFDQ